MHKKMPPGTIITIKRGIGVDGSGSVIATSKIGPLSCTHAFTEHHGHIVALAIDTGVFPFAGNIWSVGVGPKGDGDSVLCVWKHENEESAKEHYKRLISEWEQCEAMGWGKNHPDGPTLRKEIKKLSKGLEKYFKRSGRRS